MNELLDKAPCGFISFANDSKIVLVNTTLLDSLGYEVGELLGRHIESILPVASRIFYQTHFFPLLKLNGRVEEVYLSVRAKNGTEMPVLVNATRQQREGVTVYDCILMQMRQRNQYEDEILQARKIAEEATRAKDEFLAVVSHELRTPLTAILGWTRLLKIGKLDEITRVRALDTIERNANSQSQLIEDLLDFARIISGKIRLDVGKIEMGSLAEAVLDIVRPSAEAKGITVQSILDPRAGPVSGDPERIKQVLWNLMSNAVKFTPKGGRVQLRLERVDSSVEITVSDNGQGMSAEFLPYVFDRFRQADATTIRRQTGLGLGMSIARHIVELHGGTIRAVSPGEGQGASFIVRLPVIIIHDPPDRTSLVPEQPAIASDSQPMLLARLDGVNVLVVDDEQDVRDLLTTVLAQSGALVRTVGSVAEALEAMRHQQPDLLISDIDMANEDGYSLIRKVRVLEQESAQMPAIALTAHARGADRLRALSAGYQLHMPKPVEPAELVMAIANLTNRRQSPAPETPPN